MVQRLQRSIAYPSTEDGMTTSHHTRCPTCASEDVHGFQPAPTRESIYSRPSPAHTGRLPTPPADRRQDRLQLAPCAACEHDDVRVILRTPHLLYLRCYACTHLWTVPKPAQFNRTERKVE
jgi:hypothetical protein